MASLDGVDAVVTGAATCVGFAFAQVLADSGARVWLISDRAEELHAAVSRIVATGGKVEFRVVDFSDPAEVDALVVDIRSKTPRLEVLADFAAAPEAGATLLRGLLPGFRRAGGSVVLGGINEMDVAAISASVRVDEAAHRTAAPAQQPAVADRVSVNTIGDAAASEDMDFSDLAPAIRFVCGLRGQLSGGHLDLADIDRRLTEVGPDALLSALVGAGATTHPPDSTQETTP